MKKITVINPEFNNKKDIVIYGTGQIALLTHTSLLEERIPVKAFCGADTDIKIMSKPVISKEKLSEIKDNVTVVYAGRNLLDAKKDMAELGIEDY